MPEADDPRHGASRGMRLAVVGAAALAVAGGVAFYAATQAGQPRGREGAVRIVVTPESCDPQTVTVPAGRRRFEIVNTSDRPVEWEILDGVMVVEERENIAPGFEQGLTARLAPGDYAITCGLLSNPRGTLHVIPSGDTAPATAPTTLRPFIGPLSEYQFYLAEQSDALVEAARKLGEAVEAGDRDAARGFYRKARAAYARLEPVAYRFSDIANAIDPGAAYLEKGEADPDFTGLPEIERALSETGGLTGLSPVTGALQDDARALKARLGEAQLRPEALVDGAARLARQLGAGAGTAPASLAAGLDGIAKIVAVLTPVVRDAAPDAAAEVDAQVAAAREALDRQPDAQRRRALSDALTGLSEALDGLAPVVRVG